MTKFEQPANRLDEEYRFDAESQRFPAILRYKDAIYDLQGVEDPTKDHSDRETAKYKSMQPLRWLKDDQPYAFEVDREGNVINE